MSGLFSLGDYEEVARAKLSEMAYDYYAGGSDDEVTLRLNREAFQALTLLPRVLVDVATVDVSTTALGAELSMPVMLAPTSAHRLAHPEGELATVRAAGSAGSVMVLSTLSTVAVEQVVAEASGPVWFQLYVYEDRGVTEEILARAVDAGCEAVVLTVDAPWLGNRERDLHNSYHFPEGIRFENLVPAGWGEVPKQEGRSGLAAHFARTIDASLAWKDLTWLRQLTDLSLVVKGIMRADDAQRAAEEGVEAVVVSNHGGRQLDGAAATISALGAVADRVGDRCEVYLDGGVRRGTDVVKALALGARAVLLGRPVLWGLAADPDDGLARLLELLREEIELAMALCGCRTVEEVTADLLA